VARKVVERFGRLLDHVLFQRFQQHEVLLETGRNAGGAQFVDEVEEHLSGPGGR
jgi:hypothetical protein